MSYTIVSGSKPSSVALHQNSIYRYDDERPIVIDYIVIICCLLFGTSVTSFGDLYAWDPLRAEMASSVKVSNQQLNDVQVADDLNTIACTDITGNIHVIDIRTMKLLMKIKAHTNSAKVRHCYLLRMTICATFCFADKIFYLEACNAQSLCHVFICESITCY